MEGRLIWSDRGCVSIKTNVVEAWRCVNFLLLVVAYMKQPYETMNQVLGGHMECFSKPFFAVSRARDYNSWTSSSVAVRLCGLRG